MTSSLPCDIGSKFRNRSRRSNYNNFNYSYCIKNLIRRFDKLVMLSELVVRFIIYIIYKPKRRMLSVGILGFYI